MKNNNKLLLNAVCLFAFLMGFISCDTSDKYLVVSEEMEEKLTVELSKPLEEVSLNNEAAGKTEETFRVLISRNIDLDKAKKNESKRFKDRVSFIQETENNVPIYIKKDLNLKEPKKEEPIREELKREDTKDTLLKSKEVQEIELVRVNDKKVKPIKMIYRKSPGMYSFRKLVDSESKRKLEKEKAIELAKEFFESNELVKIDEFDKYGEIEVYELRDDLGSHGSDDTFKDILLLQGVKINRMFMDKPVVNSRVSLDFNPDTEEILGIKHYNWTSTKQDSRVPVKKETVKVTDNVLDILEETAKKYCGENKKALLKNISSAWFQTDTELIPILVCEIEVGDIETEGAHRDTYIQYINLAGNDDIFNITKKKEYEPPVTPRKE